MSHRRYRKFRWQTGAGFRWAARKLRLAEAAFKTLEWQGASSYRRR